LGALSVARPALADDPPVITIVSPLNAAVARPDLHVVATCRDDDAAVGCRDFKVTVRTRSGDRSAMGTSSIDTTFALGSEEGQSLGIEWTAADSNDQTTFQFGTFYVDSSRALVPVATIDGDLHDVDGARLLYRQRTGKLVLRDSVDASERSIGTMDVDIGLRSGSQTQVGWLTSNGAVWLASVGFDIRCSPAPVYSWHDGQATKIVTRCAEWLRLAGDHVLLGYTPGDVTKTTVMHLPTGRETTFPISLEPSSPGTPYPDLEFAPAPNGDVAAVTPAPWSGGPPSCPVFRSTNGSLAPVASASACGHAPVFDGTNLVYSASASPGCRTTLVDPAGDAVVLAQPSACSAGTAKGYHADPSFGAYAVSGGWTAFLKPNPSTKVQQVWVLSPRRVATQIESLGTASSIEAMNPAGEVMFANGGRRYLGSTNGPPVQVSSTLGFPIWRCGHWNVVIGNTAFRLASDDVDAGSACTPDDQRDGGADASVATDASDASAAQDATSADAGEDAGGGAAGSGGQSGASGAPGAGGANAGSGPGMTADAGARGGSGGSGVTAPGSLSAQAAGSGCGCRLGARRDGSSMAWAWLLLALSGCRRRPSTSARLPSSAACADKPSRAG
jgi:hypothetical protein